MGIRGLRPLIAVGVASLAASCSSAAPQARTSAPPLSTATSSPASADPSIPASPVAPSTATPTASTTGAPADPGPSAYPATKAGAAAITKAYYYALLAAGQQNNLIPMQSVADTSCKCLQNVTNYVANAVAKSEHIEGNGYSSLSLDSVNVLSAQRAVVTASYVEKPAKVVTSAGSVVTTTNHSISAQESVLLEAHQKTWRIENVSRLP